MTRDHSTEVTLRVDGDHRTAQVDNRVTLLDLLREHFGVTAAKKGCDHGQCGACTVLLDGRRVTTCLALAVSHDGADVRTAAGLSGSEALHPVAREFLEHDAFQCGYCTPGQICSAVGMLDEIAAGMPSYAAAHLDRPADITDTKIRERMSGNLCRCGAYANILVAIRRAAR